jgi:hypothetical protein
VPTSRKLKKQVADLQAARTQDENRHQQLIDAVQQAKRELSGCLLDAGTNAVERLEHNGMPIPGKRWYSASTEFIHRNDEEQHKENAECQRQYQNAVQEAKLLYGSNDAGMS